MNNFLLFEHEKQIDNQYLVRDKERLTHLREVLKKKAGESLNLCLVDISLGLGFITKITQDEALIEISKTTEGLFLPTKLIIAVSRPPTIKKILEHATSLGVSEFHFYKAKLTEKSFLDSKILKIEHYKKYLELGLSQSKVFYKTPKVFIHKDLPELKLFKDDQKFLLKMGAPKNFRDHSPQVEKPLSLVLGPERGLTVGENEYFENGGFKPVQLGAPILRVEIATFAALGQLQLFTQSNISS